jgi:rubrerythrin
MDEPRHLVEENLRGEKCAIRFYTEFIDKISRVEYYGADLGDVLENILKKEKEHAADLEKLLRTF